MNHRCVAVIREEWRVVDRWWTEEPVVRRYFEVVLESGENTVVFHDGGWAGQADDRPEDRAPAAPRGSGWYTQRGA